MHNQTAKKAKNVEDFEMELLPDVDDSGDSDSNSDSEKEKEGKKSKSLSKNVVSDDSESKNVKRGAVRQRTRSTSFDGDTSKKDDQKEFVSTILPGGATQDVPQVPKRGGKGIFRQPSIEDGFGGSSKHRTIKIFDQGESSFKRKDSGINNASHLNVTRDYESINGEAQGPSSGPSSAIEALMTIGQNTVFNPESYQFQDEDTAWKVIKKQATLKEILAWVAGGGLGFSAAYLFWIGGGKGALAILSDIAKTGVNLPSWFGKLFYVISTFTMVVGAVENGALTAITTKDITVGLIDNVKKRYSDEEIVKAIRYLAFMEKTWGDAIKGAGRTGISHLLSAISMFPIVFLGLPDFSPMSIALAIVGSSTQYGPNVEGVKNMPIWAAQEFSKRILIEELKRQRNSFYEIYNDMTIIGKCEVHSIYVDHLNGQSLNQRLDAIMSADMAYIRLYKDKSDKIGELYYVFKRKGHYGLQPFKLKEETLREFDKIVKYSENSQVLSDVDLGQITLLTRHTTKARVRKQIQQIQIEIIQELAADWREPDPIKDFRKRLAKLLTLKDLIKQKKEVLKEALKEHANIDEKEKEIEATELVEEGDGYIFPRRNDTEEKIKISKKKSETARKISGYITGAIGGALFYGYVYSPIPDMKVLADKIPFLQPDSIRIPLTVVAVLGTLVPYIGLGYIAGNAILESGDPVAKVYGPVMENLRQAIKWFVILVSPLSGATNYYLNEDAANALLNMIHSGLTTSAVLSALLGLLGGMAAGTVNGKYTFLMIDRILKFIVYACEDEYLKTLLKFHDQCEQFSSSIANISEERNVQLMRELLVSTVRFDEESETSSEENPLRKLMLSYLSDETRMKGNEYDKFRAKVGKQVPPRGVARKFFEHLPEESSKSEKDSFDKTGLQRRRGFNIRAKEPVNNSGVQDIERNNRDDEVEPLLTGEGKKQGWGPSWLSMFTCCPNGATFEDDEAPKQGWLAMFCNWGGSSPEVDEESQKGKEKVNAKTQSRGSFWCCGQGELDTDIEDENEEIRVCETSDVENGGGCCP